MITNRPVAVTEELIRIAFRPFPQCIPMRFSSAPQTDLASKISIA